MNESESQAAANLHMDTHQASTARPTGLVVLIVLTGIHILLNVVIFIVGSTGGNALALLSGFISSAFSIAIFIGLIRMREWARILLIWLCYVGIVSYGFQCMAIPRAAPILMPHLALEIITLIFAHNRSVRQTTKGASIAKTYTYHENVQTRKE